MKTIKLFFCAVLVLFNFSYNMAQTVAKTVWLDQLDLSAGTQGYGQPNKNRTVDGKTMTKRS